MTSSIDTVINTLKTHFKDKSISVLEIGARYGDSSLSLLKTLNIFQYYIIDPYISYESYNTDGFNDIVSDSIFENIQNILKNYPVKFIREFSDSEKAINAIDNIDLIFIDGNHTYKFVYDDIRNYFPKLNDNGIICGDDYFMRNKNNDYMKTGKMYNEDMVYEAVNDYFKNNYIIEEYGIHAKYPKTWLVRK